MRELTDMQLQAAGVAAESQDPDFVRVAATLPGVDQFAAEFFGYPPREVDTIDPQQRIFLETAWEALESAGHPPAKDGPVVGVFASSAAGNYSAAVFAEKTRQAGLRAAIEDLDLTVGGQADFLTSRVAYKLGLRGPAVSIQTGCSSSLYAVHYASLSLLAGECDIALAGGAAVLEPFRGYRYKPGGVLSKDGYCRSFDSASTGTTYSSGVGVVALRRASDALADGDTVLAILQGSAVGNDGADRLGFIAPSPAGVASVVAAALRIADVPADHVRYVVAHGTATAVGDHIELLALTEAFRQSTDKSGFCGIGSVMTNIGHTGCAAGIAGFIKAVHVARTGLLPGHPIFERPRDPGVLADSPFFITTAAQQCTDTDRYVLVNSMGVGGTNAAVVLGAPPTPTRPAARYRSTIRLVLSARTRAELDKHSRQLADALDRGEFPIADVEHTLRVGRHHFSERRVVSAPTDQLAAALRLPRPTVAQTVRSEPRRAIVVLPAAEDPPAALLDRLLAALPAQTQVVRGMAGAASQDRFLILFGSGQAQPNSHVIATEAYQVSKRNGHPTDECWHDEIDKALTAAWLHGVEVDWETYAGKLGRRVPLPTYPFTRKRYWALDRLSPADAPGVATADALATSAQTTVPAETTMSDSLEQELVALWRSLFGVDTIGIDDEFGALGGSSLLSVQMVLEIQRRHDVLINIHRAGGSKATIRRIATIVRGLLNGSPSAEIDPAADGDGALIDADLALPLGPQVTVKTPGRDVLLTGATGYLGAFLLHELLNSTRGRVYCVVRAADEVAARARLRTAAAKFGLPQPDFKRVHPVAGDLRAIGEICCTYRDGELAERVGHVLHCAAKVVFTEPYRTLRDDNVLPMVDLLGWMRSHGVQDFSFISTIAATAPAGGADQRLLETRQQALDPQLGGYGVGKWVAERILERAEQDGMRVRMFRPGLIMASSQTGACNDKDLIWFVLVSGLAVGAHPLDDRAIPMSPVDMLAKAVVELAISPGSVGRAYHLVDDKSLSLRRLFELLAEVGLPTQPMPLSDWQRLVADKALASGNAVLSAVALYEVEGHELAEDGVQARGWQPWLRHRNLTAGVTGQQLRSGLAFLAKRTESIGDLLPALAAQSYARIDEVVGK